MLDVRAALAAGELDPRVAFPRAARGEIAALAAAADALRRGELDVRRRYRGASARHAAALARVQAPPARARATERRPQPAGKDLCRARARERETNTLGPVFARVEGAEDRWRAPRSAT